MFFLFLLKYPEFLEDPDTFCLSLLPALRVCERSECSQHQQHQQRLSSSDAHKLNNWSPATHQHQSLSSVSSPLSPSEGPPVCVLPPVVKY